MTTTLGIPVYENLASQIDGVTQHFSLSGVADTRFFGVYLNGIRQEESRYALDSNFAGFTTTFLPIVGDALYVEYLELTVLIPAPEGLVARLRLHLGDGDSTAYRYTDEWLNLAITAAIEALQPWWNFRYLLDTNDNIYRNPAITFDFAEPPIVQRSDYRPIILMAGLIVKQSSLENLSWSLGAWRDAEISYSNIEGSRNKNESIRRDWDELLSLLKPPQKKLAFAKKTHLPGYIGNTYEHKID